METTGEAGGEQSYQRQDRVSRTDKSQRNRTQKSGQKSPRRLLVTSGRAFSQVDGARLEKFGE